MQMKLYKHLKINQTGRNNSLIPAKQESYLNIFKSLSIFERLFLFAIFESMRLIKYIVLIIIFIVTGFILYKPFLEFSVDIISNERVEFFRNSITSQFSSQLVFAMFFGFIPILYFIIQKHTKIRFLFDGAYVLFFIIFFGCLIFSFRTVYLIQELMYLTNYELPDNIKHSYSIDSLYFEYYLFFGFILGALISFLLLRLKK